MNRKPKIIALTGPSSTGKSSLAVEIAKLYNGEIISADSRYVYKFLDIATAKPTIEEKCGIPHHLIDVCEVTEDYSAGKFVKDSEFLISNIISRGKIPIVAGGTGLYFRSLSGEFDIPEVLPDKKFRLEAENIPNDILYNQLVSKNPVIALKIHPNNKVKIVRALEIVNSGKKMTSKDSPYDILWLGLNAHNRDYLYSLADKRVDRMFENGLIDEATFLFQKYGQNKILMNTIGIKELYNVVYSDFSPEMAKDDIKKNTRHYIKRQISWFKADKNTNWLYIDGDSDILSNALNSINNFINP